MKKNNKLWAKDLTAIWLSTNIIVTRESWDNHHEEGTPLEMYKIEKL